MSLIPYETKADALRALKRQTTPEQRKRYQVVKITRYVIKEKGSNRKLRIHG